MLHTTRGIVLRTVRYGESSLIATLFTELFGIQSYMVKGARSSKSKSGKGALLQAANQLELEVYHRENHHSLEYISEMRAGHIYGTLRADMVRTGIAIYLTELLYRGLKQPEPHPGLYALTSRCLLFLDREGSLVANIPVYYTLRFASLLGFGIGGRSGASTPFLDLRDGNFAAEPPAHPQWLDQDLGALASALNLAPDPESASAVALNGPARMKLLEGCLAFLQWHLPDFTGLNSPAVLHELMR